MLVKQCQAIHSSIGTGELAYVVGSRVMDMRTTSKEYSPSPEPASTNPAKSSYRTSTSHSNNSHTATSRAHKRKSYGNSSELPYNNFPNSSLNLNSYFENDEPRYDEPKYDEPRYDTDDLYGFDSLPVANLFWDNHEGDEENMHSFEIDNNIDLVMEADSKRESQTWINKVSTGYNSGRVGDAFGEPVSNGFSSDSDRVSEWLWTLHRIGLLL